MLYHLKRKKNQDSYRSWGQGFSGHWGTVQVACYKRSWKSNPPEELELGHSWALPLFCTLSFSANYCHQRYELFLQWQNDQWGKTHNRNPAAKPSQNFMFAYKNWTAICQVCHHKYNPQRHLVSCNSKVPTVYHAAQLMWVQAQWKMP